VQVFVPLGLLAILAGCTVDKQLAQVEAQAAANVGGCLCVASECKSILSASGRAAVEGEAAAMARQVHRETKSK
jgi:hypothetical protein